ncbi:superinfection immunity protein [Bradyrhizobium sp.]|jgi:hypothetical protein|uniref:superinfection immunity protein n=1 Tax=Bradyrhizobium sp. TaxID=376 RepID=UPI003C6FCD89
MIDLIILILSWLYLVPMSVAYQRSHPETRSIEFLNFFLGWTVIGWIVALSWARTDSPVESYVVGNGNTLIVDDYLRSA